eukprot:CAMPEP_0115873194 /NCGR_PEP_ID=MMETSP0287-20121206/23862_1 /TAXON_ID=412157 /ORGANISM="Chrysochromulina rotalis, Strain UIO044" /LENGTH=222 /DNA_ID=CAMNT_0003328231 /DNA_START=57 /DNA_END=726 /DNA_ORIENTATION=-
MLYRAAAGSACASEFRSGHHPMTLLDLGGLGGGAGRSPLLEAPLQHACRREGEKGGARHKVHAQVDREEAAKRDKVDGDPERPRQGHARPELVPVGLESDSDDAGGGARGDIGGVHHAQPLAQDVVRGDEEPRRGDEVVECDHADNVPIAERVRGAGGGDKREDDGEESVVQDVEDGAAVGAGPQAKRDRPLRIITVPALQQQLAEHVGAGAFDPSDKHRRR